MSSARPTPRPPFALPTSLTLLALALLLPLPILTSCHDSHSPSPSITNTHLAADSLLGADDLFLLLTAESAQGATDLNSDGDSLDVIVSIVDLARGTLRSTGLAVSDAGGPPPLVSCDGISAAFAVDEHAQSAGDLNGDDDAVDRILHVLDRTTGECTSLARAVSSIVTGGDLIACAIDEASDGGRDLDVDGDADGSVLAIHDARAGTFLAFTLRDSAPLAIADGRVALRLAEAEGLDLNLDGDDTDVAVLEVWDGRTRLLQNTTLVLATPLATAAGRTFGVSVSESGQGRGDLSGDGDEDDAVFHVYDPLRGLSVDLGLVVPLFPAPAVDGERFLLHALEAPGAADWNGDGDLDDLVVHVFESEAGFVHATGLASQAAAALLDGYVGVSVSEAMQGSSDLDGDGEASGNVVHVVELESGAVRSLGLDALRLVGSGSHLFLAPASVGAAATRGLFEWSVPAEAARPIGGEVVLVIAARGEYALVAVAGAGGTLALELADASAGTRRPLGLAAGRVARLTDGPRVLVLVDEEAQGADLNGDGDRADEVLHLVDAR